MSEAGGDGLHGVGDAADAVDLAHDLVAVLEPERRLAEATDAARRACEEEVARLGVGEGGGRGGGGGRVRLPVRMRWPG